MSPELTAAWKEIRQGLLGDHRPQAWCLVHPVGVNVAPLHDQLVGFLLCLQPINGLACESCDGCHFYRSGTHQDLTVLSPEGAAGMIKVDSIRGMIETAQTTGSLGGHRVITIVPADALNVSSTNALLKIVEEPPAGTFFVFQTALPGKLLPTLISRLRMIRVRPPSPEFFETEALHRNLDVSDMYLGALLLSEPMAIIDERDRFELANSVLDVLHQVRDGVDPQQLIKRFAKQEPLVVLIVFSQILEHLIRGEKSALLRLGFDGPLPAAPMLFKVVDRVNEMKLQSLANISVNLPLALGVALAAWGFIWTKVRN